MSTDNQYLEGAAAQVTGGRASNSPSRNSPSRNDDLKEVMTAGSLQDTNPTKQSRSLAMRQLKVSQNLSSKIRKNVFCAKNGSKNHSLVYGPAAYQHVSGGKVSINQANASL